MSTSGLGQANGRAQLVDQSLLNMPTTNINPATGSNYGSGAWNTGGVNNLVTKTVAITATLFVANPGTGLTEINKTDAQWLQTTGRLKNGVDFNVTQCDPQQRHMRNVAARLNSGVDPSWAVGENDGGNGYANGVPEATVGASMKFSGKTSGGGLLRPTVQNNRMCIGPLSMSDSIGSVKNNADTSPLPTLAYSDTTDGQTANYVQPDTATVTDGSYVIWQKEQYVTVRSPDANYADDGVAKGDPNGDIIKLRDNVLNSVNVHFPNPASFNDPADQLIATSFLLPQFMLVDKSVDGGRITSDVSSVMVNGKPHTGWRNGCTESRQRRDRQLRYNRRHQRHGRIECEIRRHLGDHVGRRRINIALTAEMPPETLPTLRQRRAGTTYSATSTRRACGDFDAIQKAQATQATLFTNLGARAKM